MGELTYQNKLKLNNLLNIKNIYGTWKLSFKEAIDPSFFQEYDWICDQEK